MKVKYNSEKLQKVIDDFAAVTELTMSVLSEDMTAIASNTSVNSAYCTELQKADTEKKCGCCDADILKKCRETKRAVSHVCHAGLTDMVVPITKNDSAIGYLMIGRIKQNPNFDEIFKSVSWAGEYEYLKELYQNLKYYTHEQTSAIMELALMLTSFILLNDIITIESDSFTESISSYINENLTKDLSVSTLCRRFNISKNYLYSRFHTFFNCTVNDYVNSKRIERAKEILLNTNIPISDVAEECGIYNHTYFCRLFKRKTGISPAAYRKINK